jgi:hypothetical protein
VAGLWLVGVALAGSTAPVAWRRIGVVSALPFVGAATVLALLTIGVLRSNRAALALSTVGLGGQIFGVIGTAWELSEGVAGPKARELRRLGVDPTLGVALNLVYSALASLVFAWVVTRWWAGRRGKFTRWRADPPPG